MGSYQEASKSGGGGTYRNASKRRGVANDSARGFGAGLIKGVAATAESVPFVDPYAMAREGLVALDRLGRGVGLIKPSTTDLVRGEPDSGLLRASRFVNNFSSSSIANRMGADYEPETRVGRYAKTVGEFVPGAVGPAKGGLIRQGVTRTAAVVVPAVASEGAGQAADAMGAGEGGQAAARFAGGLIGGAMTAVRPPARTPKVPVPTVDEMRATKTAAYQAVDAVGAAYKPEAVTQLVDDIAADLSAAKISPTRHKNASSMLKDIQKLKNKPQTLTELDQLRQVIRRDVANTADEGERFMGEQMIKRLDDFIDTADQSAMIAGDAQAAGEAITGARAANTRFKKVEAVTNAVTEATDRTGTTGSGGNIDNAIRQNLRGVLKRTRNLTPDETKALRSIVRGDAGQNFLRAVGKFSPQNPIIGTVGAIGGTMSGGPLLGAAVPAAGYAAKNVADKITLRKVDKLIRLMAAGGAKGLQAEAQLAQLASQSPEAAVLYNQVSELLLRGGTASALAASAASSD